LDSKLEDKKNLDQIIAGIPLVNSALIFFLNAVFVGVAPKYFNFAILSNIT